MPYTDDFGVLTFHVTQEQGEELFGTSIDAVGTLTVTRVGDELCAEVDYHDQQKELSGTLAAPVKSL